MLVLSRRPGERIVFPSLGITIEVLRSKGALARLGIEAPDDVPVMREEVIKSPDVVPIDPDSSDSTKSPTRKGVDYSDPVLRREPTGRAELEDRQRQHDWKNKLNNLMLKLQLLQRQLELGRAPDAESQFHEVFLELSNLEQSTTDAVVQTSAPKVLIVEDQANERELLASCLRLGGIEVATAGNGREAFDYLHDHDLPDLVLLDMRMPEVDGPALLKLIRDDIRLHDLRVFALSGSSRHEFDADPLPIDGWISKPVRIDALIQAVRIKYSPTTVTA